MMFSSLACTRSTPSASTMVIVFSSRVDASNARASTPKMLDNFAICAVSSVSLASARASDASSMCKGVDSTRRASFASSSASSSSSSSSRELVNGARAGTDSIASRASVEASRASRASSVSESEPKTSRTSAAVAMGATRGVARDDLGRFSVAGSLVFLNPKPYTLTPRARDRDRHARFDSIARLGRRVYLFCVSCRPSRSSREIENHVEPGLGAVLDGARALEREPAVSLVKRYEILFAQ